MDIMDIYVARQPVFGIYQNVLGYELFYRSGRNNFYDSVNGDQATIDVLINSFINIGIDKLTNSKPCFINFTENLLKEKVPFHFPPSSIIVEILESIPVSRWLIDVCKELKEKGYTIALDDFVLDRSYLPILPYVDIIKVDFLHTPIDKIKEFVQIAQFFGIKLLAEKVETHQQFRQAAEMGFSYFQGFFFSKPVVYEERTVPALSHVSCLSLLEQLNEDEPDLHKIAEMVEHDLSLTYRLLKFANSIVFPPQPKIKSIYHAIVILGLNELKKWVSVLALQKIYELRTLKDGSQHHKEIINLSFIRGKACELLAHELGHVREKASFFLMGMCSLLDALLNQPLPNILEGLNIHDDIRGALSGEEGRYANVYRLVQYVERGEWERLSELCEKQGLDENKVLAVYQQAIEWTVQIEESMKD
jgi:c-di-GMP-related signal transduction protein